MARILAIDTTGDSGSLALIENGSVIEEVALESPDGFAHVLFGEIEHLLALDAAPRVGAAWFKPGLHVGPD